MPLAITLKLGDAFYVRDSRWVLKAADNAGIYLHGPQGKIAVATADKGTELEPNVYVSEGIMADVAFPDIKTDGVRLVFNAPRSISILREGLYNQRVGDGSPNRSRRRTGG